MDSRGYQSSQSVKVLGISVICDARKNLPLLLDCLKSFQKHHSRWKEYALYTTIAFSRPGYADKVREIWPESRITETSGMRSYSQNHNNNMKLMNETYTLLLNDDVLFVENVVDKVLAYLDEKREIVALSPKLLNPDGSLQPSINAKRTLLSAIFMFTGLRRYVRKGHWTWSVMRRLSQYTGGSSPYIDHDSVKDVWSFAGACQFIRRGVLGHIGLMDEVTQFWGEEAEWHRRMIEAGGRVVYFPKIRVVHLGGQTTNFKSAHYKFIKKKFNSEFEINRAKAYLSYYSKWHYGIKYNCIRYLIIVSSIIKIFYSFIFFKKDHLKTFAEIIKLSLYPKKFLINSVRYPIPSKKTNYKGEIEYITTAM